MQSWLLVLAVQSEQSDVCQDHMACLTIHFFTDTAKKLLPAALLMQNGCSFQGKVGMVHVIIQKL